MTAGHAAVGEAFDEEGGRGSEGVAGQGFEGGFEQGGQGGGGEGQGGALEVAAEFLPQVGVAAQAPVGGWRVKEGSDGFFRVAHRFLCLRGGVGPF